MIRLWGTHDAGHDKSLNSLFPLLAHLEVGGPELKVTE